MNRIKKMREAAKGARLLAAAILFAAPGLAAGATGFSGKVTQEDGVTGISGVTVQVLNPADDSVLYTNTTGGDGSFDVPAAAGTFHIQAVPAGYFPAIRSSHTLAADQYKTINFALQSTGSEGFRDDFSSMLWSKHWDFTDPDSALNNGNVEALYVYAPITGSKYVSYTKVAAISKSVYPYVTVRHRYTTHHPAGGGLNSKWLVYDKDGGWASVTTLADASDQSTPWLDRTYAAVADVTTGMELVFGDAYNGIAPSSATLFLDHIIFHSVDRGFAAGQVTGKYGTALPNARVQLRKGSVAVGEALTDAAGNYNIWGAVGTGYNIYVSSNGAEFVSGSLSLTGRTQTAANVAIDTAPPAAVTGMFAVGEENRVKLYWTAPGDDGSQGTLNNSTFTIQYATYTSVAWSTAAAQLTISTTGVAAGSSRQYDFYGLAANTTHYFRLWTKDAYGTYSGLSNGATAVTMIENPTSVYMDEVGSGTIVASAYASTFTNLTLGMSGVAVSTDSNFDFWGSTGNYWTNKNGLPSPRAYLAAGAIGGKLYAVGGQVAGLSNLNEEYDPVSNIWQARAPLPIVRSHLAAGVIGGKLYAVGGNDGVTSAKNEEYDPVANSWRTRAYLPTAREGLAAGVIGGKLYAVGGWSEGVTKNNTEEYDPASDTWVSRAFMPTPRQLLAGRGNKRQTLRRGRHCRRRLQR